MKVFRVINAAVRYLSKYETVRYSSVAQSPSDYCLEMVKKYDHENFLCSLLLPKEIRTSAFAIRAFNIEIARVQDSVSDLRIGNMRLKFWEEAIDSIYEGNAPKQPVALELQRAIQKHNLSKRYLKKLISTRYNHFLTSFPNLEAMEMYAEGSTSPVYYLLLEALDVADIHADHVASHLGKAQGLSNLVRSVPHYAQKRVAPPLPENLLMEKRVSQEEVIRGNRSESAKDVVFAVAARAAQHLEKARSLSVRIPKLTSVVFLPGVAVGNYLEKLRLLNFDLFDESLHRRNNVLPFKLYWNKIRSSY